VSISQAQIRALQQGEVQKLGFKPFQIGAEIDLPVVEKTLALYGQLFNDEIVANLYKTKSVSSGDLAKPAIPQVVKFGTKYILYVGYKDKSKQLKYYDYINRGVKGTISSKADSDTPYSFKTKNKSVPIEPIKKWIEFNNLKSISVKKYTKLGVEQKEIKDSKSLAFLIARGIHRKGIKTTRYFDDAVDTAFRSKQFTEDLRAALGSDFEIKIRQLTNGYNDNK
jgi:hypothetical protein